jgi:hypothetical protein
MGVKLYDYQLEAIEKMKNGCILCGGVGTGKSMTAIGYFYIQNGGDIDEDPSDKNVYIPADKEKMKDLYIITTARKRDTCEWEKDLARFLISPNPELNYYNNKVVIDSWNNLWKYKDVKNAFFIFDEQRVVGYGKWAKSFIFISKRNDWVLLSATPGDTWMDYIPVFIANGFYKNKTDFTQQHVMWSKYTKFPKVERYYNTRRLVRLRDSILIDMNFERKTIPHHETIQVEYDIWNYKKTIRDRWNFLKNEPIQNAGELCYELRRITNSDISRIREVVKIANEKNKVIVFYNYDYELDILKSADYGDGFEIAEWNGHKHQPIPDTDKWIYLVQYNAGAEGWNCIQTDTIIFYSQNYSYKMMAQASGRIDRLNTPYTDLYYYHLKSKSSIDVAIGKSLSEKKKFNETKYCSKMNFEFQKAA